MFQQLFDFTSVERYNLVGAGQKMKSFSQGQDFWGQLGYIALVFIGIYLLIKILNRMN